MESKAPQTKATTELLLQVNDVVRIGHDVTVQLTKISQHQARFAIGAPRDVGIHRAETHHAKQKPP
ncbi:carbon storage regulator [Xanthomonas euvesicatoria]